MFSETQKDGNKKHKEYELEEIIDSLVDATILQKKENSDNISFRKNEINYKIDKVIRKKNIKIIKTDNQLLKWKKSIEFFKKSPIREILTVIVLLIAIIYIPFTLPHIYGSSDFDVTITISPDDIYVGDSVTISVLIPTTYNISSVSADMAGIETIDLALIDETTFEHLWQGSWVVHDLSPDEHIVTVNAMDFDNSTYSAGVRLTILPEELPDVNETLEPETNETQQPPFVDDNESSNETIPPDQETNDTQDEPIKTPILDLNLECNNNYFTINETVEILGYISFQNEPVNTSVNLKIYIKNETFSYDINVTNGNFNFKYIPDISGLYSVKGIVFYNNQTKEKELSFQVFNESFDIKNISLNEFKSLTETDQNITIFDIRGTEEYNNAHIENAIGISSSDLNCNVCLQNLFETYEGNLIIIYGFNKFKIYKFYQLLLQFNFSDILLLNEHINSIKDAGLIIIEPQETEDIQKQIELPFDVSDKISNYQNARVIIKLKDNSDFNKKVTFLQDQGFIRTTVIPAQGYIAGFIDGSVYDLIKYDKNISEIHSDNIFSIQLDESLNIVDFNEVSRDYNLTGQGKKICIIDTGVDNSIVSYSHGYDFLNDDEIPDDEHGHGTKVASILKVIAPNAELIVAKVIGSSGYGYESTVLEALEWCIAQNPDVISFSIGSKGCCDGFCDNNFLTSLSNDAVDSGIFVVAAAGNNGLHQLVSPACGSNVFSVGSTDDNNEIADFSNVNPTLDIFAPGVNIETSSGSGSGTSFSAPHVTGTALLMLEKEDLNPLELKNRLRRSGKPIFYKYNDSLNINLPLLDIDDALSNNFTLEPYDCSHWWQCIISEEKSDYEPIIDEFENTDDLGWELLDNNTVIHAWNKLHHYYFDNSNGLQLTNHYDKYWTQNVMMLGYYNGNNWNLVYRTDELTGFNRNFEGETDNFMNLSLWKDLTYSGYNFRVGISYTLGIDDQDLTIIPYIKNIGSPIPYNLGFGWELKDIKIDNTYKNDQIRISDTSYLLNQTLDKVYTDIVTEYHDYDEGVWNNYTAPNTIFYLDNLNNWTDSKSGNKTLYLKWDHNLDYKLLVKSRTDQYNAPVTLFIKVGNLGEGQEKYTKMNWFDSDTLYERYNTGDDNTQDAYDSNWIAQTFTIGDTGTNECHQITSVKLKLFRVGSPGTLTVGIRATDGSGKPTGSDLTSGTTNGNTLPTSSPYEWREFSLTAYALAENTKYSIVLRATSGDSSNYVRWRGDGTSPTYSGGSQAKSTNSGSSWTLYTSRDFLFEEYGTNTAPTASYITGAANTFAGKKTTTFRTRHTDVDGVLDVDDCQITVGELLGANNVVFNWNVDTDILSISYGSSYAFVTGCTCTEIPYSTTGYDIIWQFILGWNWPYDDSDFDVATYTDDESGDGPAVSFTEAGTTTHENDLMVNSLTLSIDGACEYGGLDDLIEDSDWFSGGNQVVASGNVLYEGSLQTYDSSYYLCIGEFEPGVSAEVQLFYDTDGDRRLEDLGDDHMDNDIDNGAFSIPAYTPSPGENDIQTFAWFDVEIQNICNDGSDATDASILVTSSRDNEVPTLSDAMSDYSEAGETLEIYGNITTNTFYFSNSFDVDATATFNATGDDASGSGVRGIDYEIWGKEDPPEDNSPPYQASYTIRDQSTSTTLNVTIYDNVSNNETGTISCIEDASNPDINITDISDGAIGPTNITGNATDNILISDVNFYIKNVTGDTHWDGSVWSSNSTLFPDNTSDINASELSLVDWYFNCTDNGLTWDSNTYEIGAWPKDEVNNSETPIEIETFTISGGDTTVNINPAWWNLSKIWIGDLNVTSGYYFNLTNDGSVAVNVQIMASNATNGTTGATWELNSTTAGNNNFTLEYQKDGEGSWTNINISYDDFVTNLQVGEYQTFDLKAVWATESNTVDPMTITVTFKSVAA